MPPLKFNAVVSYSSEDSNHPAENLLKPDTYLKWKSKPGRNEKQEYVTLKLEKMSKMQSIDIGNEHSAFVEVLVSRDGADFQVLLVASSFMSPLESRNGTTPNRVRMFGSDKLNKNIAEQKWDTVKVICTQPFNRNIQYGLTFIKIYGPEDENEKQNETKLGRFTIKDEEDDSDLSAGSLFAKRKEKALPLKGAAAIRAASNAASTSENIQTNKRPLEESENAPAMGFYQLKKQKEESPHSKLKEPRRRSPQPSKEAANKPNKLNEKASTPQPKQNTLRKPERLKNESQSKIRKSRPFNQLMSDVVFVMSGYQNPQRSQLRDNLVAMGAKYKSDWGPGCTHLICAFKNTPKYQAVKGKGKIVTEKWIEDSYKNKIRKPWRRYSLDKNRNDDESEEEIWATEICPKTETEEPKKSRDIKPHNAEPVDDSEDTDDEIQRALEDNQQKNDTKNFKNVPTNERTNGLASDDDEYDADTDVDEEQSVLKKDTSSLPLPSLKNFLKGKTFFIYGSIGDAKKKELLRYIIAFQGQVADYMNDSINFVLTDETWDDNFDEALNNNPSLQFVKPQWIWKCCDKEKFVPPQPFLVVPKD